MIAKPLTLLILDGWGFSEKSEGNAIIQGDTPALDKLNKERPPMLIHTSGEEVGLPAGVMGNSEVGHLNIGAGRVVYQDLPRISHAISDGSFFENKALLNAVNKVKEKGVALHLCGLLSDAGVHSHMNHILALLELAKRNGLKNVFVHPFTDGRDTPPDSGLGYIEQLENGIKRIGVGAIATVQGRFHAMDRDKRWDRVEKAYNLLAHGKGRKHTSATDAIRSSYENGVTDEFIEPVVIVDNNSDPVGFIKDDDEVIMFNFRADRMREIVHALSDPSFSEFSRGDFPKVDITCMTEYDEKFNLPLAFDTIVPEHGLGQVISENGLAQLRTAETEKYAHVTFFFNGGVEKPFEGETRNLIPSPRVTTYDLQPAMSCAAVTDSVVDALESGKYQMIVANIANGDMVGHTGVWEAALKAVHVVDTAVGRIIEACEKAGAHLIITADHGNIEKMIDENKKPMTAHTTNLVPFYYVGDDSFKLRGDGGRLADIAPTILSLLGIKQPDEMTGVSLLKTKRVAAKS